MVLKTALMYPFRHAGCSLLSLCFCGKFSSSFTVHWGHCSMRSHLHGYSVNICQRKNSSAWPSLLGPSWLRQIWLVQLCFCLVGYSCLVGPVKVSCPWKLLHSHFFVTQGETFLLKDAFLSWQWLAVSTGSFWSDVMSIVTCCDMLCCWVPTSLNQ